MGKRIKAVAIGILILIVFSAWSGIAHAASLFAISQTSINTSISDQTSEASGEKLAFALNISPVMQNSVQIGTILAPNINSGSSLAVITQHFEANPVINQTATAQAQWAAIAINVAPTVITNIQVGVAVTPQINIFESSSGPNEIEFNQSSNILYEGANQTAQASGGMVNIAQNHSPTVIVDVPVNIGVSPTISVP